MRTVRPHGDVNQAATVQGQRRLPRWVVVGVLTAFMVMAVLVVTGFAWRLIWMHKYSAVSLGTTMEVVSASLGDPHDEYTPGALRGLSYQWWREEGNPNAAASFMTWRYNPGAVALNVGFDREGKVVHRAIGSVF